MAAPGQDEFFNAKSILTPSIGGLGTMLIANTLSSQFGLPANYTALIVSFVVGLVVFRSAGVRKVLWRLLYYLLNSVVIFTVAIGINETALVTLQSGSKSPMLFSNARSVEGSRPFFSDWFSSDALRYVEEWLDGKLTADELRDLLLGAKDLRELERLRQQGEKQIEHDKRLHPRDENHHDPH
ncbi:MAG: hypothetical protein QOI04_262 [Verrucomicrobiota bacterium]|jgi:hypothetical protein